MSTRAAHLTSVATIVGNTCNWRGPLVSPPGQRLEFIWREPSVGGFGGTLGGSSESGWIVLGGDPAGDGRGTTGTSGLPASVYAGLLHGDGRNCDRNSGAIHVAYAPGGHSRREPFETVGVGCPSVCRGSPMWILVRSFKAAPLKIADDRQRPTVHGNRTLRTVERGRVRDMGCR